MRSRFLDPTRPLVPLALAALALVGCRDGTATSPTTGGGSSSPAVGVDRGAAETPGPPTLLVSGLEGTTGGTVGPDGQLYVTEGAVGRVSRIDPRTGEVATVATGLPPSVIGLGGAIDLAFRGHTAYVLVTLADDPVLFPTGEVNGIYRIDGPDRFTVIADIGAYNIAHPPTGFDFFVSTGLQYALMPFRDGFLVTDGHLNRVLRVTLQGDISVYQSFGDIVPTGIAQFGGEVYLAEAGPVPHNPEDGKIVALDQDAAVTEVMSGCRLCVDVRPGAHGELFALGQGIFGGGPAGSPALPTTGTLSRLDGDGSTSTIAEGLNQPTAMEFIGSTAYIISLAGEVWTVEHARAWPPDGRDR